MKIDNYLPNPWLDALPSKTDGPTASTGRASDEKQTQTAFPSDIFDAKNTVSTDIRADKVEALQRVIASGAYQVSAENIADSMLRDWQG